MMSQKLSPASVLIGALRANHLFKHFGVNKDRQNESQPFDILIVFLKDFFFLKTQVNFENSQHMRIKNMNVYPSKECQYV